MSFFLSLSNAISARLCLHTHSHTISRVFIPLSMHDKAHATIIWFEYVVCLWFYCCFRMIVLSFAKWHVDALLSLPLSVSLSRTCTPSVYTHFHVIIANCVTIWLIVRHMMLFCCFDTLQTRSHTRWQNVCWILYCRHCRWFCQRTDDTGLRSEKRWNKNNSTYSQLGKCYEHIYTAIQTTIHIKYKENVHTSTVFMLCIRTEIRFSLVHRDTWVVILLADFPSNELLNSIEFPSLYELANDVNWLT